MHIFSGFSKRAVGSTHFVAVGFNPPNREMPAFQSSVGTEHLKYAVPTEIFGGLKPTATKWVEPMALEKCA